MAECLGKVRNWIQWNALNGSAVIWGSDEVLRFTKSLTVKDFENLAKEIAGENNMADMLYKERLAKAEKSAKRIRGFIDNPEDDYDIEDLKGELENVKCDIILLKWVLGK